MPPATLTVWKFDDPKGADEAVRTLEGLARENLISVLDAATVSWEEGEKKPKTRQSVSTTEQVRSEARSGACCSDSFSSFRFSGPPWAPPPVRSPGRSVTSASTTASSRKFATR